ncbi:alkaline phosphatase family protein, partial [Microvirga massiliensis]|uniref:alkaline phosphatase family protein n=1 Tax=Microvirga massiliensis TaxID=1033741 RepID=UPI000699618A
AHTRDLIHAFYTHRTQIHGGKNDWFALFSDAKGLTMGYYSAAAMKDTNLWKLAQRYTLLDNFFMGALGGSFFNHMWLVCACAPVWPDPPKGLRSQIDESGAVVSERKVTAVGDGDYAVNTTQSIFLNNGRQGGDLLPAQTTPTIGDRLSDKGVEWAWYSGGWNLAIKPNRTADEEKQLMDLAFQWHHQPFAYFARFNPTTETGRNERTKHLRDAVQLEADIRSASLPPVAFYKPVGVLNQHPGYANLVAADEEVGRIIQLMDESPMKNSYAVIITYDENGGAFDHVSPPQPGSAGGRADFFGPGSRVPAIVVSPFAEKGTIDHTQYETTSILRLISERHRLAPLPSARYGAVESLARAFDFGD